VEAGVLVLEFLESVGEVCVLFCEDVVILVEIVVTVF
jgi:hypothetical protein